MQPATLTRQRKTKNPCARCGLNPSLCICNQIPQLQLKTRVVLVIHAKELKRTTNSGRLALQALTNSVMQVRGQKNENGSELDLSPLLSDEYESLLFYPSDDAVELSADLIKTFSKPVQLFVPDGNWRQAAKVHTRHKELAHLPRVMILAENKAKHHLRKETSSYGMSTLEAIAKAISIIEGLAAGQALENLYQAKLQNTLKARGIKPTEM